MLWNMHEFLLLILHCLKPEKTFYSAVSPASLYCSMLCKYYIDLLDTNEHSRGFWTDSNYYNNLYEKTLVSFINAFVKTSIEETHDTVIIFGRSHFASFCVFLLSLVSPFFFLLSFWCFWRATNAIRSRWNSLLLC